MPSRRTLLCGLAAALILGTAPVSAQSPSLLQQIVSRGTIRIAVLPSLPPYSRVTPGGEPEGYDVDIAKRLADALKVKPEFVVTDIPGRVTSLLGAMYFGMNYLISLAGCRSSGTSMWDGGWTSSERWHERADPAIRERS